MPRPQKYDWDDKRDICYKLYVEQKLPASEIVTHFANHFNLPESELPPTRAFHKRFKQWGFPVRVRKIDKETEPELAERTKELFRQNFQAQQILEKLNDEGWDLNVYHFRTLRRKHGLMFRAQEGYQPAPSGKKRKRSNDEDTGDENEATLEDEGGNANVNAHAQPQSLDPEEEARRAQRLADLQLQSDHLLQQRKRRRRIRGFGHMGPDAPGLEPRYKSETSLDESKAYLHLSNELYNQIRDQYEGTCREMGIIKMSLCAEGQWQASKDRLIRENAHLSSVLHPLQPDIEKRLIALNCICSDVTKRMRVMEKVMTIADANNILGLDPLRSKEIRRLFYEILEADQFTTVLACGKEHFEGLKEQWYSRSEILQRVFAEGDPTKIRAMRVLSKDARKRYCDNQARKNPDKHLYQHQKHYGPGPGPAKSNGRVKKTSSTEKDTEQPAKTRKQTLVPVGSAWEGHEVPEFRMSTLTDLVPPINFDLDPLLSNTTHGPPWPPQSNYALPARQSDRDSVGIPAYFRLAPDSQLVGYHPRMWLGKLSGANVHALHKAATSKAGAAKVIRVSGVVKNGDGYEDSWLIESDDELAVYLEEVREKATFVVSLEGATFLEAPR